LRLAAALGGSRRPSAEPEGAALLRKRFGAERFVEVDASYYQALEEM
jgi:hypothetical protein